MIDPTNINIPENNEHPRTKTNDPQLTVTGTIKANNVGGELITFTIPLGPFFSLACIVNVPADGDTEAPVYIKFKIRKPSPRD